MPRATYSVEGAEAIQETSKAILVEANEFETPQWVPISQITDDSEVYQKGDIGTLVVTEYIAQEKGWI